MLKLWVDKNINMNKGAWDAFDYSATVAIEMHASSNKKRPFGLLHTENSVQADALLFYQWEIRLWDRGEPISLKWLLKIAVTVSPWLSGSLQYQDFFNGPYLRLNYWGKFNYCDFSRRILILLGIFKIFRHPCPYNQGPTVLIYYLVREILFSIYLSRYVCHYKASWCMLRFCVVDEFFIRSIMHFYCNVTLAA